MNNTPRDMSAPEARDGAQPLFELICQPRGPAPCRCGGYFSEDFEGRLFCRACEGTDAADVTSRLPLCHGSK